MPESEEEWARDAEWAGGLPRVLQEVHQLQHHVQGIESLEKRLEEVAEDGQRLLNRLLESNGEGKDGSEVED